MNYVILLDGPSVAIVLGGTILGTVMRSGFWRSSVALRGFASALRRTFDADRARAALAVQVQDIQRNGLLRAEAHRSGDPGFDVMTEAVLGRRSVAALHAMHKAQADDRRRQSEITVATFSLAADLAPLFGLAGTLVALSQLPTASAPGSMLSTSIPMAVVTTFLGVIAAHLFFAPVARFIERRAEKEEYERQKLVDWLATEVERETARSASPRGRLAA
jgi:chemotaxis protein MotA